MKRQQGLALSLEKQLETYSIAGSYTVCSLITLPVPEPDYWVHYSSTESLLASRRLVWLLVHGDKPLDAEAKQLQSRLFQVEEVALAYTLTQQFRTLLRDRDVDALSTWLEACQSSGIHELVTFAEGLQREAPPI